MLLDLRTVLHFSRRRSTHQSKAAYFIEPSDAPALPLVRLLRELSTLDYIPEKVERIAVEELAENAASTQAEFVVVTGGEPTIHDLRRSSKHYKNGKYPSIWRQVAHSRIKETSIGLRSAQKRWKLPRPENLELASEFKVIVDRESAIEEYCYGLELGSYRKPIWLHPEWTKHEDAQILNAITESIKAKGAPYRAGWQMHKPYRSDNLDPKSAAPCTPWRRSVLGY